MINPLWATTLRNFWPLFGAIAIFVVLNVSEQVWFQPTVHRYQAALKAADELGMPLDPRHAPAVLPPRLFALLTDNSLPAADAVEQGNSGALTAQLLEEMTDLVSRHGMRVTVTEPGPVSLQDQAVQVRAHLRAHCSYDEMLTLLADLSASQKLISLERFALTAEGEGGESLDLWVSRYVLKQSGARK
jgi:type II secretion system (T2SS) protein M